MKILCEFDNKKFGKFWYCKIDFPGISAVRGQIRGIRANSARAHPRGLRADGLTSVVTPLILHYLCD